LAASQGRVTKKGQGEKTFLQLARLLAPMADAKASSIQPTYRDAFARGTLGLEIFVCELGTPKPNSSPQSHSLPPPLTISVKGTGPPGGIHDPTLSRDDEEELIHTEPVIEGSASVNEEEYDANPDAPLAIHPSPNFTGVVPQRLKQSKTFDKFPSSIPEQKVQSARVLSANNKACYGRASLFPHRNQRPLREQRYCDRTCDLPTFFSHSCVLQ
jgi:hypothetical protein